MNKKAAILAILAVFFIIFDRFFKILAQTFFIDNKIEIINNFFKFNFAKNYFIAFSIPISGYILNVLIVIIIFLLLIILVKYIQKTQYVNSAYLFMLILGASSNLFDRLRYGYVIDYFDLQYFTIFNLADCIIIIGAVGLLKALSTNTKNSIS